MIRATHLGLGTKLRLLLAELDGELAKLYEKEGLHFRPRFYPVFQLLMAGRQATVSEIANFMQASQPAATQTLAEMKRLDLIIFTPGSDKRERIATLTPKALAVAKTLQPIWSAVEEAAAKLDGELSYPLSTILEEAITALHQMSFPDRISEKLSLQGE